MLPGSGGRQGRLWSSWAGKQGARQQPEDGAQVGRCLICSCQIAAWSRQTMPLGTKPKFNGASSRDRVSSELQLLGNSVKMLRWVEVYVLSMGVWAASLLSDSRAVISLK